jgi:ABC-type Fe2+-enterobactin transport system substrate-binding protein
MVLEVRILHHVLKTLILKPAYQKVQAPNSIGEVNRIHCGMTLMCRILWTAVVIQGYIHAVTAVLIASGGITVMNSTVILICVSLDVMWKTVGITACGICVYSK